jgi:hypothetical protein
MFTGHLQPIWKNRTWIGTFKLTYKDDNGALQPVPQDELEDVTFTGGLYEANCSSPVISAQSSSGIEVVSDGVIEWRMEASATNNLCPGVHILKLDVSNDTNVEPLFGVNIPVRC